jgi:hypothetical protein
VTGAAASLAGLDAAVEGFESEESELAVRRILAAWSVVLGVGGVPVMDIDDVVEPQDQSGPEAMVQAGVRRILDVRRSVAGPGNDALPLVIDLEEKALIAYRQGPVVVLANLTSRPAIVPRNRLLEGDLFDLISDDDWDEHVLGPYEYRYLLASS